MSEEQARAAENGDGTATAQQGLEIVVNDTQATAGYANFCRVSSTPEELILDMGLNPKPYGSGRVEVNVTQRVILNHFTAKRLANALAAALNHHEKAFGELEMDVRKRVQTTTADPSATGQ